jgi:DNA mismatch endonuclease (patch repair protein)
MKIRTRLTRPEQMARIRGQDTEPELQLRRALWSQGLRYRLRIRIAGSRPDLVFPRHRVVVFIDGCFWHGCPYHYVRPRTRHDFWAQKLSANVERDRRLTEQLGQQGWRVVRLWEHEVLDHAAECVAELVRVIDGGRPQRQWRVVAVEALEGQPNVELRRFETLDYLRERRVYEGPRSTRSGHTLDGCLHLGPQAWSRGDDGCD